MKVRIEGEVYDFDQHKLSIAEGIALEKHLGMTIGEWNTQLQRQSAYALAGMVWLIWRRAGRDVAFGDIVDGTAPVDLASIEGVPEPEEREESDPTPPPDAEPAPEPVTA